MVYYVEKIWCEDKRKKKKKKKLTGGAREWTTRSNRGNGWAGEVLQFSRTKNALRRHFSTGQRCFSFLTGPTLPHRNTRRVIITRVQLRTLERAAISYSARWSQQNIKSNGRTPRRWADYLKPSRLRKKVRVGLNVYPSSKQEIRKRGYAEVSLGSELQKMGFMLSLNFLLFHFFYLLL